MLVDVEWNGVGRDAQEHEKRERNALLGTILFLLFLLWKDQSKRKENTLLGETLTSLPLWASE